MDSYEERIQKNTVKNKIEEHQHLVSGYIMGKPRMKMKKY